MTIFGLESERERKKDEMKEKGTRRTERRIGNVSVKESGREKKRICLKMAEWKMGDKKGE